MYGSATTCHTCECMRYYINRSHSIYCTTRLNTAVKHMLYRKQITHSAGANGPVIHSVDSTSGWPKAAGRNKISPPQSSVGILLYSVFVRPSIKAGRRTDTCQMRRAYDKLVHAIGFIFLFFRGIFFTSVDFSFFLVDFLYSRSAHFTCNPTRLVVYGNNQGKKTN